MNTALKIITLLMLSILLASCQMHELQLLVRDKKAEYDRSRIPLSSPTLNPIK
tara:strand:- start:317 stop:475 length:159 start_codon:yes stop_codon:yes gene_type:complete